MATEHKHIYKVNYSTKTTTIALDHARGDLEMEGLAQ